jgi:ABC-2 type transport system permease protein
VKSKRSLTGPNQIAIGAGLVRYVLKATFRNKAGYFFSFIFPLVFVIVFGLFGNARQTVRLGVSDGLDVSGPVYQALKSRGHGAFELIRAPDAELRRQVARGRLACLLAPDAGAPEGVTVVTAGEPSSARIAAESFIRSVLSDLSLEAAGVTQPAFRLTEREIPARAVRHIDFILPGQIGFSMLSLATFGIAFNLSMLRRTLVLKRMFATAVRPLTFVIALGLSRSVQAVLQSALIITLGVLLFHFTLARGLLTAGEMLVLSFLGILAFLGFGILIANIAEDEHTLPVVMNLFNLPQILLAGVFFPTDSLPRWLQHLGNNLPLAYLNTSLRRAANDGAGLPDLWPYILGMFAWGAVAYVLAARTFKTE